VVHATDLKMILSGGSIMIWNVVVYYQKDRLYKSLSDVTRDSLSADHNMHSQNVIINYHFCSLSLKLNYEIDLNESGKKNT
jgi:hypothetical protein